MKIIGRVGNNNLFIVVIIIISIMGCSKNDNGKLIDEVNAYERSGGNWLELAFSSMYTNENVNYITNRLSSYRYVNILAENERDLLIDFWKVNLNHEKWNQEIIFETRIRILVAEILCKYDEENYNGYHDYLLSSIKSQKTSERAYAALSLGFVGDSVDIEVLKHTIVSDNEFASVQAGFALIVMNNSKSIAALQDAINVLSKQNDNRSKAILSKISEHVALIPESVRPTLIF